MANYPQVLAQDAVCQSHTGHMTGLWFLPARPLRLNTNEWMNWYILIAHITMRYMIWWLLSCYCVNQQLHTVRQNYSGSITSSPTRFVSHWSVIRECLFAQNKVYTQHILVNSAVETFRHSKVLMSSFRKFGHTWNTAKVWTHFAFRCDSWSWVSIVTRSVVRANLSACSYVVKVMPSVSVSCKQTTCFNLYRTNVENRVSS